MDKDDSLLTLFFYEWPEETVRTLLAGLSLLLQTKDPSHSDVTLLSQDPAGTLHFMLPHPLYPHLRLATWASAIHAFSDARVRHQGSWRRALLLVGLARTHICREFFLGDSVVAREWCGIKEPPLRSKLMPFLAQLNTLIGDFQSSGGDPVHVFLRARSLWVYGKPFLPPPGAQGWIGQEDEEEERTTQ
jgi:hypothetical protein